MRYNYFLVGLVVSLMVVGLSSPVQAQSIQNPYYSEGDWKLWYDDQSPVTVGADTLNPTPEFLRFYPVDPTPSELATGLYMKFVPDDYAGRRYAGFFNDAYDTTDGWHSSFPWEMMFEGGNRVTTSDPTGGSGKANNTRYITGDEYSSSHFDQFGVQFSNQSQTGMGDDLVRFSAKTTEERWYFKNTLRAGPAFSSYQTGTYPQDSYPALFPVYFNGEGASYRQFGGYGKMMIAGAYMPTTVKRELLRNGLLPSTVLYNWKSSLPYQVPYDHLLRHRVLYAANGIRRDGFNIPNMFDYMSHFQMEYDSNIHMKNMVTQYKTMNVIPPIALIKTVEIVQGAYNTKVNGAAELKTLVALEHPASGNRSVIVRVSTEDSFDLQDYPLTVRAKLLYGNKDTQVDHESEHVWKITVPWDATLPEGRTDLIFVANNGVYDSNPAVVSVMRPFDSTGDADQANGFTLVRTPSGLPQKTRLVPGESVYLDLSSEDTQDLPISFYLHEGAEGEMDGNRYEVETDVATAEGLHQVLVTAANERTGDSLNGTWGRLWVQNTVAEIESDLVTGDAPLTVAFDASTSRDRDGNPLTYTWDFNDGSPAGNTATTSHTFTTPGIYTVGVTASGALGSDTHTVLIQVEPNSWGLALNRGWIFDGTPRLDTNSWTASSTAPTIAIPNDYDSAGHLEVKSALTSVEDFALPLWIESDFKYSRINLKHSFFDLFGHRIGFMQIENRSVSVPDIEDDLARSKRADLAFQANYENEATVWGEPIGGIAANDGLYSTLRLSVREDPNHAGKMIISGEIRTEIGTYPIYFDNLDKLNNKLKLVSTAGRFKISRFQVWTPTGSLFQPDLFVTDEQGERLWDNNHVWGVPYPWKLLPSSEFGITPQVNGSITKTYTLHNRGTAMLNLTGSPTVNTSAWGPFKDGITQPATTNLAPGESTSFSVTFNPTQPGVFNTDIWIANNSFQSGSESNRNGGIFRVPLRGRNATEKEINVEGNGLNILSGDTTPNETDHTDFGTLVVGKTLVRDFTIHNRGTMDLTFGAATLSGASEFTIVKQPRNVLTNFGSTRVTVQYTPTVGTQTATLTIPSDDADEATYTFVLSGTGEAFVAPDISMKYEDTPVSHGATLDLGIFPVTGNPVYEPLEIYNGSGLLTISNTVLSGADVDAFHLCLTTLPSPIVASGVKTTVQIQFTPESVRSYSTDLTIYSDDADTPAYTLHLIASGSSSPVLSVYGEEHRIENGDLSPEPSDGTDFGFTGEGLFVDQLFTLENPSTLSALTMGSLTFSGIAASDYQILPPAPTTIPTEGSVDFTVRFSPSAVGARHATLSIPSDADDSPFTMGLTGRILTWTVHDLSSTVLVPEGSRLITPWVDYDQDGDLDLFRFGQEAGGAVTARCYQNSAGTLTEDPTVITPTTLIQNQPDITWSDYDNDGDVDFFVIDKGFSPTQKDLFRNDAGSFVQETNTTFGILKGRALWSDIDNDGDQDLTISGTPDFFQTGETTLYVNDQATFTNQSLLNTGIYDPGELSYMAWVDVDGDGDLDWLAQGQWILPTGGFSFSLRIYENAGGVLQATPLQEIIDTGEIAFGDFDADGDMDLIVMGQSTFYLYRNDNGTFTPEETGISSLLTGGSIACGDMDQDGDLDLAITGSHDSAFFTRIFENRSGMFNATPVAEWADGLEDSSLHWVDYDSDNDLDLFITGTDSTDVGRVYLYENKIETSNAAPEAITGVAYHPSTQLFSWDTGSDDTTPTGGLTYNIRIGTNTNPNAIASGMASDSGFRYQVKAGSILPSNHRLNLSDGIYTVQVQAVDASYVGGAWSAPIQVQVGTTPYEIWSSNFNWNGADSSPTGDGDLDGVVNRWEYAMDLDPLVFNASPFLVNILPTGIGPFFQLDYRHNKLETELTWSLLVSSNLRSNGWTVLPVDNSRVWITTLDADVDGDGSAELMQYSILLDDADSSNFFRLGIEW